MRAAKNFVLRGIADLGREEGLALAEDAIAGLREVRRKAGENGTREEVDAQVGSEAADYYNHPELVPEVAPAYRPDPYRPPQVERHVVTGTKCSCGLDVPLGCSCINDETVYTADEYA
jgi:hypothetical protein